MVMLGILVFAADGAEIESLFYKGAQWQLTLDDWDGPMVVQDQRLTTDKSGMKLLSSSVMWKNRRGKLDVREYTRDPRRAIFLAIELPNGESIEAEGFLARESDTFMAGVTRHATKTDTYFGAWYARRASTASGKESVVPNSILVKPEHKISKKGSGMPGGIILPANPQATQQECRLSGGIGGLTEFVASGWLQPKESGLQPVEVPLDGSHHFDIRIPAGIYQFGLVPRGKLDLQGPGVSQEVNCRPGGNMRLSASVNNVGE